MRYSTIRKLLFALDPESAHDLVVTNIERIQQIPIVLCAIERFCRPPASARRDLLGLSFPSPIGIAAGFDKNAVMMPFLAAIGFGFLEVGTVTPLPQAGNPRPRMFRYPEHEALINRMGFNNDGATVVAERLKRWRGAADPLAGTTRPPLFVNIGKNRDVPLEAAAGEYAACYARLAEHADAVVLNVSSPNTPSLRELQRPEHLTAIISAVRAAGPRRPLLIKIAPDIDDAMLVEICTAARVAADGMICTNTTTDRLPGMTESGGLSGQPLLRKSTAVLSRIREIVGASFPLIGVGGVSTADDVRAKFAAGADLIQLYTSFIYRGPLLPMRLVREVAGQ